MSSDICVYAGLNERLSRSEPDSGCLSTLHNTHPTCTIYMVFGLYTTILYIVVHIHMHNAHMFSVHIFDFCGASASLLLVKFELKVYAI